MASFSIAAAATQCEAIACRIIATRGEVDEALKAWEHGRAHRPHIALLGEEIHTLSAVADSLTNAVRKAAVVSPAVQAVLMASLNDGEQTWAVVDKQLRRLRDFNGAEWAVDSVVIEDYEILLQAEMALCELFREILEMSDASAQQSRLQNDEVQRILSTFKDGCAAVMCRRDILVRRNTTTVMRSTSTSSLASPSSDATQPSTIQEPDSEQAARAGPSVCANKQKSSGTSFFGGLSHSFQAMTANFRYKPEPFVSALCQSAARGDLRQVKGLIEGGANVDGRNEEKKTALICAVLAGQLSTVQYLLDEGGADIRARDGGNKAKPPLFHAVKTGSMEMVQLLLHRGADVNARSPMVNEAYLVGVVHGGNKDMIQTLLQHGGDANTRDLTGRTLLVHAINGGNLDLVRLLLSHGADVNSSDMGQPLVFLAANADKMDILTALLDHGADPNTKDMTGQRLLVHAVTSGKRDLVRLALKHGADPNVHDFYGRSVLQFLVRKRDMDLIRIMLEHGASPNQLVHTTSTSTGETLLLHAIDSGDDDLVELLIKHGADVNANDKHGHTPLMQALRRHGKDHLVRMLVESGADANMEGLCSPLTFVTVSGRADMARLLQAHGAVPVAEREQVPTSMQPPSSVSLSSPRPNVGADGSGSVASFRSGSRSEALPLSDAPEAPPPDYNSIHTSKSGPGIG